MTKLDKLLRKPLWGIPSGPPAVKKIPFLISPKKKEPIRDKRAEENNLQTSQSPESEYFTVVYQVQLTKKWKRLLLQTYLDMLIRREELFLTLADFLILEDLQTKIYEENSTDEQDKGAERRRYLDAEILYITELFLKHCPAEGKFFSRPGMSDFRDQIVLLANQCKIFNFSDERTFRSRAQTYHHSKFLEITVVVPLIGNEKNRSSQRYSSFCKGHPTPGRRGAAPLPLDLRQELGDSPELAPETLTFPLTILWAALNPIS